MDRNSAITIHLDVSDLEPPKPMERILEALSVLGQQEILCVFHRREPFPLYKRLKALGFDYETTPIRDSQYQILIWLDKYDAVIEPSGS